MSDWAERKAQRVAHHKKYVEGWKSIICTACSGSGYYDNHGCPRCSSCNGTGKERVPPNHWSQNPARALASNK